MRAIQVTAFGGPEVLRPAEVPRPVPGPGQVLLRVAGAGVNFADLRMRAGNYVRPVTVPLVPGFEVSGYVEEAGPGCEVVVGDPDLLRAGQPVVSGDARAGYAEYAVVPADLLFALPSGCSLLDAAALPVTFVVAWLAVHDRAELRSGETVMVHAAGGGVGTSIIQLAKLAGARVVALASSEAKLAVARAAGADVLVDYSTGDHVEQVRDLLGSAQPIDVLMDSIGGETLVKSLDLLRFGGRMIGFGQASDQPARIDLYDAAIPNQLEFRFVARGTLTASRRPRDRARLVDAMASVVELWGAGAIRPSSVQVLPLEQAAEAHRALSARGSVGKYVLEVG